MPKERSLIYGGAVGAALGGIVAPRLGESRRAALTRLRLSLRPGRGSVGAFAGTPCSEAALATAGEAREAGGVPADSKEGGRDA
jgi:hypothetical protein